MARPTTSASISFGLVQIPVTMYTSEELAQQVELSLLHRRLPSALRCERVLGDGLERLPLNGVLLACERGPDQWVVISEGSATEGSKPPERKVKARQTIEIVELLDRAAISPAHYGRPYLLEPGEEGTQAYALLRRVLKRERKVALASVAMGKRRHLAVLRVQGSALILETLRFVHESEERAGAAD